MSRQFLLLILSVDADQIPLARDVLAQLLQDPEMKATAVAIFANKQDCSNALPVEAISEQLGLTLLKDQTWAIFKTSAITGEGLKEGLEWVARTIQAATKNLA